VEQDLWEALSAVAASVLPFSLALLVLRSPLGWKNTQNSVTRTQLWWEALAEIQPSAAFRLGSSQSRSGFVRAQSLTYSVASAKPLLRDTTAQNQPEHALTSLLAVQEQGPSTSFLLQGKYRWQGERKGESGLVPRHPCFGVLLGKQDSQDLGDLSQSKRVPHKNIIHLCSIPGESGVNGVSHLSC